MSASLRAAMEVALSVILQDVQKALVLLDSRPFAGKSIFLIVITTALLTT